MSSSKRSDNHVGSILLIHGSAPFDANGNVPHEGAGRYKNTNFYRDLAVDLEARGWRVFRYSKPGVGKSSVDFENYKNTDMETIGKQLNSLWAAMPQDQPRFIFAWSEGSLHVHLLPFQEAQGIVLLGGVSTNLKSVILSQAKSPTERQEIEKQLKEVLKLKRDAMVGLDRPAGRLVDEFGMADNWTFFAGKNTPPMLILHGGSDNEVPASEASEWQNKIKNGNVKTVVLRGRNHMLGLGESNGAAQVVEEISSWRKTEISMIR